MDQVRSVTVVPSPLIHTHELISVYHTIIQFNLRRIQGLNQYRFFPRVSIPRSVHWPFPSSQCHFNQSCCIVPSKSRLGTTQVHHCRRPHHVTSREQVWTRSVCPGIDDRAQHQIAGGFRVEQVPSHVPNCACEWNCQRRLDGYYAHATTTIKVRSISGPSTFTSHLPMVSRIKFWSYSARRVCNVPFLG